MMTVLFVSSEFWASRVPISCRNFYQTLSARTRVPLTTLPPPCGPLIKKIVNVFYLCYCITVIIRRLKFSQNAFEMGVFLLKIAKIVTKLKPFSQNFCPTIASMLTQILRLW